MASTSLKQLVSSIHETIAARPVLDDLQHLTERTTGGLPIHAGPLKSPNQRICNLKSSEIDIWVFETLRPMSCNTLQHGALFLVSACLITRNHTISANLWLVQTLQAPGALQNASNGTIESDQGNCAKR